MNGFSLALFLHIIGALGVFVALSLEWISLRQIQSALLPEQVRPWMGFLRSTNKLGFPSMVTTVVTGIYMVLNGVGWVPWILVVIGSLVLMIVLSVVLTKPRMVAIGQALVMEKGPLSPSFHNLVNQPALWISIQSRGMIALGIIFLKIAQPDLVGSLLTIGIAILLGLVSALPMSRRMRLPKASTH